MSGSDVKAAADRLTHEATIHRTEYGTEDAFSADILLVARSVAALEAQVERYREALDSAADALTGTAWYAKSVGHMGLHQNVQDVLKGIETALATAGPAQDRPDHLWSMLSRPENHGNSLVKACCNRPQSEHAGVTWGEYQFKFDSDDMATAGPGGGGEGE